MDKPLRIALVANNGWYLYNFRRNLMRALQAPGHDVIAVAPSDDYTCRLESEGNLHRHISFKGASTNPFREARTILALRRIFLEEKTDLVLSYTP